MRIYCVSSFASFPSGLLNELDAIASSGKDVELIAGILDEEKINHNDRDNRNYSENHSDNHFENDFSTKSTYTLDQRAYLLRTLKSISSVVVPSPLILKESFFNDHNIDAVYHIVPSNTAHVTTNGTSNGHDPNKRFAVPIALGIFRTIQYNLPIKIPKEPGWENVWETKGQKNDPSNTRLLTGYDETDFEPQRFAELWSKAIQWVKGETVLDVGCGAGFLGDHLPKNGYVGVEWSPSQAKIFIQRSNQVVIVKDAISLPFKDGSFDHVISHSMLEYMPGKPEAIQAVKEMQRVSRKTVFLGDLRTIQHAARPDKYVIPGVFAHTLFQRSNFSDMQELNGFVVSDPWWGGETRFNAMYRKNDILHVAIIGGGPAGCGLLTNYALNDEYEDLLDRGVAIFDSSQHLGGGSLHNYNSLRSNSHGCAFFDAIEGLGIETQDKHLNVDTEIPMKDMCKLQLTIGSWHEARLARHPISRSLTKTTVLSVNEKPNGLYCIRYSTENRCDKSDRFFHEILANNICVCTGGIPYTPSWVVEQCESQRLESAEDYFSQGNQELKGPRIAVIGFSHSAFSVGHLLQKHHPSASITYIKHPSSCRQEPRIYFPSTDAAHESMYGYESIDVDPDTGRVHRFGGLRGDARTFALSRGSYQMSNVLNPDDYDHIIVACGFRMRIVPIFDKNGVELRPESEWSGSFVSSEGLLFPDHQIYAFGLGAGLPPSKETGGEPGCTRRADGIWLYQYTVGSTIRNSLKQRSTEWKRIYNRIGSNATPTTPLHHIGGYNMFSQQEWDEQVRILLDKCGIATNLDPSTSVFESGCGGGAFLDSLQRLYGYMTMEGCDQSSACVGIANLRLDSGVFWVGDASDLSRVPDASKAFSFMFGVTPYLNNEDHAERAVHELIRITKSGGVILIAENNDLERKHISDAIRRHTHMLPSNHLFLPRSFWNRFPNAEVFDHAKLELKNPMAAYRNSVVIKK